jgi:DNA polymerase (family 10)
MATTARDKGYEYCAITDHSKNLAMTNGMDEKRTLEHARRIRAANEDVKGIRILAGIECDILADGTLDLSHDVLDELDIVVGSVHSRFSQSHEEMTERIVRAISSGKMHVMGHPFGRLLLRREGYTFDFERVCKTAVEHGVALEHNSDPNRLDLSDTHLRIAKSFGVKFMINTDAHSSFDYGKMKYGILQLRRAWLTKEDVLNTLPLNDFLRVLRRTH